MKKAIKTMFLRPIKRLIEKTFGILILKVANAKDLSRIDSMPHSEVLPLATYSPWEKDAIFNKVYEVAKDFTLVDKYRMYELFQLSSQAAKVDGVFLEVGVWRGGSSAVIQAALENVDANKKFYIADTFQGVVKAGSDKDTFYHGGEHSDTSVDFVKNLFSKVDKKLPEILIGIFPDDHKSLDIENLAFVHSDVDAYQSTKDIIEWCLPRMSKGGIIVFDDYGFRGCEGVTEYVNDLIKNPPINENYSFIHNLNGHAILIRN